MNKSLQNYFRTLLAPAAAVATVKNATGDLQVLPTVVIVSDNAKSTRERSLYRKEKLNTNPSREDLPCRWESEPKECRNSSNCRSIQAAALYVYETSSKKKGIDTPPRRTVRRRSYVNDGTPAAA